jgi:phage terminase large subunit-like protein
VVKTRLAEKNSLKKKFYYDMNPPKKKHWSYKLFIIKKNPEDNLPIKNPEDYACLLMNPKDNLDNLDKNYMKILDNLPKSKRDRFRDGLFGDDEVGEVFDTSKIRRIDKLPADIDRIVVGYDPAVTSKITSDEHGIIICARKGDFGYVVRDMSGIYTPQNAAKKVISGYHEYECDRIISEVNQGGDYIEVVIKQIDQNVSYKAVRATRGKVKRAEPVGALYEQGRIFHVGHFPELEAEMGDFKTNEKEMEYSPNHVDALVWAMASLFNLSQGEPRIRSL